MNRLVDKDRRYYTFVGGPWDNYCQPIKNTNVAFLDTGENDASLKYIRRRVVGSTSEGEVVSVYVMVHESVADIVLCAEEDVDEDGEEA